MVEALYKLFGGEGQFLYLLAIVASILAIVLPLLIGVAFAVYFDRKIWAAVQMRRGPNVVGPFGLLQSFADGLKLFLKETIIPAGANKAIFLMAPMITFVVALLSWAVIPFEAHMAIADINVGILYLLAISSLGVYGIIMSGWASNSRYAFLGGLRSAAQMVSYEVSIGFVLVCVLMHVGSLNMTDIVNSQSGAIWHWNFIPFFPVFIIFFISALAETNRPPFDLPEAEAELVAGYQVEYSSMAFALFFLGEYANILLMSTVMSILFFGGWNAPLPGLEFVPGFIWLLLKTAFFFWLFAMVKAFVPRYRYDQLMRLGWKVFLPLSLFLVVFYAAVMVYGGFLPTHG
ncbi:NADH-quinone oxidoreductase subunit NuoH [Kordiimonas marina]|uniref:NADH-quinone oxidoreductase subunit NuoH n=1 Tax=Kordiimonas marina TaxID=2872312 RepID=UPI001FF1C1C0|nr:NADH-quinone oxidoreductase subunit NuoH [Kordiimonas marina]MCJ9428732.1 NADH-quinone oxidoreductase subunit NuoH [Kordiimonas marina]